MTGVIYPCLWFDDKAKDAAVFYCSLFPNSKLLQDSSMVTTFELNGTKFMGLNGGPKYKVNAAISFYVYCGDEREIDRLYKALLEGGRVLMPLDKYDWSEKYAWIADKFGVNWQLDISSIHANQKIVPSLLFANEKMAMVKDAVMNYTNIFNHSEILMEAAYPKSAGLPEGTILFTRYKLGGLIFNAMSSTIRHDFDFSPAISFVIECDDQREIDNFWDRLGQGGHYEMCGWLVDKFGVSWQIVPSILPKLMSDPEKGQRVIQSFLKMQKFDIEALLNA